MTATAAAFGSHRDLIIAAIDTRLYSIDYLDTLIRNGTAQVRTTDRAAIAFASKHYPTGCRDVHGLVAAGDLRDIVETLIPQAEAWGRANGCSGALIESRPGWARILKHHGYEPHQLAVRKEL